MSYAVYPSGNVAVKLIRGITYFDKDSGYTFYAKQPKAVADGVNLKGIVKSKNTGTMNFTGGTCLTGTLNEYVTEAIATATAPGRAMVVADYTGTITFYLSRDNGTTWTTATPSTWTTISGQPNGTALKAKAVLSAGAKLKKINIIF